MREVIREKFFYIFGYIFLLLVALLFGLGLGILLPMQDDLPAHYQAPK